jgi:hypothetical protein
LANLTIRLTTDELEQINATVARLQAREHKTIRVTQRIAVLRGIEQLQKYLDKLDSDRGKGGGGGAQP